MSSILYKWSGIKESELETVGIELRNKVTKPAMIILDGPVGAGKTTFTKNFITHLEVFSPTYSLVNEIDDVVHADLYRIKDASEIIHLELPLYLEGKKFFLVEWGAKYKKELERAVGDDFKNYLLSISIDGDNPSISTRTFTLEEI